MKFFSIIVSFLILASTVVGADLSREMKRQNRKIVTLAAEEISKSLPKKIDNYTQLVSVSGQDLTLIYTFEINTGAKSDKSVQKEDEARMRRVITKGICQSSKQFLNAQINITYLYRSVASKAELFRFDIIQSDCIPPK